MIPASLSPCTMTRGLHWNRKQEMCVTKLFGRVWSPAPNCKSLARSVCCTIIHWHRLWKTSSSSGWPQDFIHFISKQEILGEILIWGLHSYNSLLTKEGSTSVLFKQSDQTDWIPYSTLCFNTPVLRWNMLTWNKHHKNTRLPCVRVISIQPVGFSYLWKGSTRNSVLPVWNRVCLWHLG